MSTAEDLARRVGARRVGREWRTNCPIHNDEHPSLDFTDGDKGALLFSCRSAGCDSKGIAAHFRSVHPDIFQCRQRRLSPRRVVKTTRYQVKDSAGVVVAVHVRQDFDDGDKTFWWEGAAGSRGLSGTSSAALPLYGSEHLATLRPDAGVIVTEGEKAADAVRSLRLSALGTVTGAASCPSSTVLEVLRGRRVILWPDSDAPGRQHVDRVAQALAGIAAEVRLLTWGKPGSKDDAADFVAAGGTREQLIRLVKAAPLWESSKDALAAPTTEPAEADAPAGGAVVVRLADVKRERVEWLWPGRFPLGKLVLLDGDPDLGKTTVALDLAGRITRGISMPGEERGSEPANVLLLMAEDGLGDTIRPRLEAAGADLARVFALRGVPTPEGGERLPMLPDDGELIRAEAGRINARVIFLDPLFAYVSPDCNIFRDQDVRRALQPLVRIGEDLGCSIMVLRHLNKTPGGKALYRGGGSIGIIGAARAGLLVAEDPDDNSRRVLAVVKCNLGPKAPALAYRLVPEQDVARIAWDGPTEHTPAQLLAGPPEEEAGVGREAEDFLREALATGARPSSDLIGEARQAGISERTLWRAKRRLGVAARKEGRPGGKGQRWTWALPNAGTEGCHEEPKAATISQWQPSGGDGRLREDGPGLADLERGDL